MHYSVDTPNKYEISEDAQKVVEIKIIDILYNNKVSQLVYMRDITVYVNQNPEIITEKKEEDDEDLDAKAVTRSLLKSPITYIKALTEEVNNDIEIIQVYQD